jgi:hypothetical protein
MEQECAYNNLHYSLNDFSHCFLFYPLVIDHKHSKHEFEWHHRFGTDKFQTDKLWKVARAIISARGGGYE